MAAVREVRVPDIGDFRDVPIIEILVAEGQRVARDQGLVTLESDKATMEVPSPAPGVIKALRVKVGDAVSEGHVIALLESEEAAPDEEESARAESPPPPPAASPEPPVKPAPPVASPSSDSPRPALAPVALGAEALLPGRVPYASPAVRAYARRLGADLSKIAGTGRKGRILKEDVESYVRGALAGSAPAPSPPSEGAGLRLLPWPKVDFAKYGPVERQPLSRIKKISGANLARNWAMIPHVTQHDEADITELESFRRKLAEEHKDLKITPLVFLIKAVVAALKAFPHFNASLDEGGENLVLKRYFHIGVAVDTPEGLVVPVIRDCEKKGLLELARELAEVSARARAGKLGPADMAGGCFSISSLGGIGGTAFTPIINAPEVAILGVSRSQHKPVWTGERFEPRLMLPLSLSYDHRVIDGADAARFTGFLARVLGDIRRLLL
jgi:pyruvate dehydrogenase E2 component (dihydrolipoamide acetyltransferase)